MSDTLKIVIPMAGLGTRLRPHTWSKPKQLVSVAGKAVLDHVLDTLNSLPEPQDVELINIVGYLAGQIEEHMEEHYPEIKSHYVLQENPRGQSHAIHLAKEYLHGPALIVFADTLIDTDLGFLADESAEAVVWVKPVEDPRRFGVTDVGEDGMVKQLIEKPSDMSINLAVVGFYYFQDSAELVDAIEEQMEKDIQLKGEYYLADAVNIMLERGLKMRPQKVDIWLDAGTPEALLDTNRYLLENGRSNTREVQKRESVVVIPPVYVHPSAKVVNSILGPHVSLGKDCRVESSVIRNSILEDGSQATDVILEKSLIGRHAQISRRPGEINAGDHSIVAL